MAKKTKIFDDFVSEAVSESVQPEPQVPAPLPAITVVNRSRMQQSVQLDTVVNGVRDSLSLAPGERSRSLTASEFASVHVKKLLETKVLGR